MHFLLVLAGSLKAAALVGTAVFAATLIYVVDRTGWGFGLLLGWAPALLLGLAAAVGHLALALMVQAYRRRRRGADLSLVAAPPLPAAAL